MKLLKKIKDQMFRPIIFVFLFIGVLFICLSFSSSKEKIKPLKTIIIDPGHGGRDIGAPGKFSTESKICLEIGLKLGKSIEQNFPGVTVLYTRTTDIIPGNVSDKNEGLRNRADFANQSGGDLFISIHVNAAPRIAHRVQTGYKYVGKGSKRKRVPAYRTTYTPNPVKGTETYIWAADESGSKERHISMSSEDIGGETDSTIVEPDMNDPVMKAMQLLYAKKFFENSLVFADFIEQEFTRQGRESRGVKQRNHRGIWVLHATGMPSVLVETGFIGTEEEYLNSDLGQDEIVTNVTDALRNYIGFVEKKPTNNQGGKIPETKMISNSPAININKKEVIR